MKWFIEIALTVIAIKGFIEVFFWWRENKENNSNITIAIKALIVVCGIIAALNLTWWPIIILGATAEIFSVLIKQKEKQP